MLCIHVKENNVYIFGCMGSPVWKSGLVGFVSCTYDSQNKSELPALSPCISLSFVSPFHPSSWYSSGLVLESLSVSRHLGSCVRLPGALSPQTRPQIRTQSVIHPFSPGSRQTPKPAKASHPVAVISPPVAQSRGSFGLVLDKTLRIASAPCFHTVLQRPAERNQVLYGLKKVLAALLNHGILTPFFRS